ncbi:MAG: tripartite tricarboxylate transporter substrate binding protein [Burkholderiales bacterium]
MNAHCKLALALLASLACTAFAQTYPSKPVKIIVPFPPGGAVDLVARLMASRLTESFAQPVLVDNRPGAGGNIGADLVAKSAPDGTTILLTPIGHATSPALFRKLPYDPADLIAVTQLIATDFVFVVAPKVPAGSVKELVALAKAKSGGFNYGSTGIGAAPHLAFELLKLSTGMEFTHIPYKGDAPQNAALMANEIEAAIAPTSTALAFINSGKIRALAVTGPRRNKALPNLPAITENDVPGYEFISWQGFFVQSKTPKEIVGRIHRDSVRAVNSPEVRDKLQSIGSEIVGSSPEEFEARFKAEMTKFARVVKEAKIPPQD